MKLQSFNFSLIDDTESFKSQPLINYCLNEVVASVKMEDGNDDPAEFVLKMIGISKYPYLDASVSLHMEASYFNSDVDSYEPLIEPWSLDVYARQKQVKSSMDADIKSH